MSVPQLVIAWNPDSGLVIEAPGRNGAARTKVEGVTFDQLPAEIQTALIAQRDQIAASRAETRLAPKIERPDPDVERRLRNEEIFREKMRRWQDWIDALPPAERERQLAKKAAAETRRRELEDARAKQIWEMTALNHGTPLANRVITDPRRRGRLAKRVNSAKVNGRRVDKSLAIKISL